MPAAVESMAYSKDGGVPWHGLGKQVDGLMTAAECLTQAGLDWEVEKRPIYHPEFAADGTPRLVKVPGQYTTVRKTDQRVLGVVKEGYTVLQNADAFGFFDKLVSRDEAMYETAGSLRGGKTVFINAKLPGEIRVHGDDVIQKYAVIANSHDGSMGVICKLTGVRVVCMNTLLAAFGSEGKMSKIRHTVNVDARIRDEAELMGLYNDFYANFEAAAKAMFATKINKEVDLRSYLEACLKMTPVKDVTEGEDDDEKRDPKALTAITNLYEQGRGTDGTPHTIWRAYNAVTEYIDHKDYRSEDSQVANAAFAGAGYNLKTRAWEQALAFTR
jgi:phage/plasmid-like protein (TIGR03299 family)